MGSVATATALGTSIRTNVMPEIPTKDATWTSGRKSVWV
jgi:hypothetical protein